MLKSSQQTNKPRGKQEKRYTKNGTKTAGVFMNPGLTLLTGKLVMDPSTRSWRRGNTKESVSMSTNTGSRKRMKKGQVAPIHQFSPSPPQMKDSNAYLRWWPFLQPGAALVYPETTGPGGPRWWVIKDDRQYRLFARQPSWTVYRIPGSSKWAECLQPFGRSFGVKKQHRSLTSSFESWKIQLPIYSKKSNLQHIPPISN